MPDTHNGPFGDDSTLSYLGDGVYATFDGYQVWVHTSDGLRITNSIALEPKVFKALQEYYCRKGYQQGD